MKIKVTLGIGIANARQEDVIEIPDVDLEGLDEEQRAALFLREATEWSWEHIDIGYEELS